MRQFLEASNSVISPIKGRYNSLGLTPMAQAFR